MTDHRGHDDDVAGLDGSGLLADEAFALALENDQELLGGVGMDAEMRARVELEVHARAGGGAGRAGDREADADAHARVELRLDLDRLDLVEVDRLHDLLSFSRTTMCGDIYIIEQRCATISV